MHIATSNPIEQHQIYNIRPQFSLNMRLSILRHAVAHQISSVPSALDAQILYWVSRTSRITRQYINFQQIHDSISQLFYQETPSIQIPCSTRTPLPLPLHTIVPPPSTRPHPARQPVATPIKESTKHSTSTPSESTFSSALAAWHATFAIKEKYT